MCDEVVGICLDHREFCDETLKEFQEALKCFGISLTESKKEDEVDADCYCLELRKEKENG